MAAETVIIDVQTNYSDRMSPGIDASGQKLDKMMQSIEKMQKQIERINGSKANPTVEVQDKATSKLEKVSGFLKNLGKNVVKLPVTVIDKATAPLRKIFNYATSIKGILTGLMAKVSIDKIISDPIALADAYSSAKIGFQTLLGEQGGQQLMDKLDQFAKATPFKTSNTISQAQRMIAMGWDAENIVKDMTIIGDAAAATGKGDEGLQRIVTALAQIKSKGKLSTEELNQLAEAGISAKKYLAEGLGFGSGDEGIMKLSDALQKGAIGSEQAIQAIMQGMQEYQGMMERTANETVSGLKSQIEDTFEINIFRKWGQGLQDGAKKGLGSIVKLLDASEESLSKFGDALQEIGSDLSNLAADKLENVIDRILEVSESTEFQNADMFGKIKIMWDKVISEPFGEWWDNTGYPWMVKKMGNLGEGLGKGLSDIFKGLLGFNAGDSIDDATSIGSSFAKGFLDGFDGSGVAKALTESIKNAIKDALNIFNGTGDGSSWVSAALLGYGGLKALKGANSVYSLFSGKSLLKTLLGNASMQQVGTTLSGEVIKGFTGKGLAGLLGNAGYAMGSGATTAGGLVAAGGLGIAGGAATLTSALHAGSEFADAYAAYKEGNKELAKAKAKSGGWTTGGMAAGMAAGAAIGSVVPGVGTVIGGLVGAGIGGVAGWWQGSKEVKEYEASVKAAEEAERQAIITKEKDKYVTDEMKQAVQDLADEKINEEQFNQIWKNSAEVADDLSNHFGKLSLSMEEINSIASNMILGSATQSLNEFASAAEQAHQSFSYLQSSQDAMVKLNWKAQMGFINDEESASEFKTGIDSLVQNAKDYVENSHYEATAAINVFLEPGEAATGETDLLNTLYENINSELSGATEKLQKAVDEALCDGKISPTDTITIEVDGVEVEMNEAEAIRTLQDKVTEITDKIANAKHEAKMTQLQVDFQMSDLTADSWQELQSALEEEMKNKKVTLEDAFNARVASYNLEFGEGLITQEELDSKTKEATADYVAKIDEMKAEVEKFNFDTLEQTYGDELNAAFENMNLTGTFEEKFKAAMEGAESEGVDISEYLFKNMSTDEVPEAARENIQGIAQSIAESIPKEIEDAIAEVSGSETSLVDPIIENMASSEVPTPELPNVQSAVKDGAENAITEGAKSADTSLFGNAVFESIMQSNLPEGFELTNISSSVKSSTENAITEGAKSVDTSSFGGAISESLMLANLPEGFEFTGLKQSVTQSAQNGVKNGLNDATFSGDYGVPGKVDSSLSAGMTSDKFSGTGSKAASACQSAITSAFDGTTMSATANISVTPKLSLTSTSATISASGAGTGSGTVSFSVVNNANGGIVGSKVLSWLAEEGYPEFVIPTAPHRRARALDLLAQAEETLGVEKHASGGIVGGMLPSSGSHNSPKLSSNVSSGNNISVNVGGVTISVNADGKSSDIVSSIKAKKKEISKVIQEMMAEALGEAFENMPLAET